MKFRIGILALIWKTIVGLVFSVTAVLFYPFIAYCSIRPNLHRAAFTGFVVWSWVFRVLCFYHIRRVQKGPLPAGPFIIAPNHASYLDIFLMPTLFAGHPFRFLGKSEILGYPLIKTYFRNFNIPVDRSNRMKAAKAFIQVRRAIQSNWSMVIFPEGGIPDSDKPKMMPFKDGAFQLAKDLGVPIVPVTFVNNHLLFSDPEDVFGYCRPGIATIVIHEAIGVEEMQELTVEALKQRCFETIQSALPTRHECEADGPMP